MNPLLIFGAIAAIIAFTKKAVPAGTQPAGGNLNNPNVNNRNSSTPVPTPSNNTPSTTPPFFQQSNAATPSEPVTKVSFDSLDLNNIPTSGSHDTKGNIASPVKTSTVHNNIVLDNTWDQKLQVFQTRISHGFIADTEQTSVSQEQAYAYGEANGTPNNPDASNQNPWGAAKINNAGGTNGTYPSAPPATVLSTAHTLAPTPPKNTSLEKIIPKIASSIVKTSLKPSGSVTKPTTTFFKPLTSVYGA